MPARLSARLPSPPAPRRASQPAAAVAETGSRGGLASPTPGTYRAAWLVLGRCLVRGTRPNRRQGSPAAAPRGDRGCRLGWAGSAAAAGWSRLVAPARAPVAVREEGGVGETPGNSNSGRQSSSCSLAPARCRRVRASKTNLPPPLPVSMPSAAVPGEPQRPGPGQRSVAESSGSRRRPEAPGDKWGASPRGAG